MVDQTPLATKPKKIKKQGPIRFEAVIPALVIIGLIIAYFSIFFDSHLKSGLEYAATQANGAEVNISRVKTSFLTPSFHLYRLQITDKNRPERNLFEVAEINFILLWDGLLRAKVVVEEASINNIQALTPRSKPGRVVPPSTGPSKLKELESKVLSQTKEQFNQNILGDIASVVGGAKPEEQLKNLQADLKSDRRIKEIEKELKQKELEWKQRLEALPQSKELKDIEKRFKALKFDGKNPVQFASSLKEADKLIKEVDQKIKAIESTGKSLNSDLKAYDNVFKELDEMVKQDLKDLQSRLKIPSLDPKEFTMGLLGGLFQGRLVEVQKYMALAREYMPPKKTEEEKLASKQEALLPRARSAGEDIRFRITTSYPLFWLKRAAISSEPTDSEFSGRLSGELTNLTSNPPVVGKPTILNVEGDFPKKRILGFSSKVVIDHVGAVAKESLEVKVGSYPQDRLALTESSDVTLAVKQAQGQAELNAKLENQQLDITIANRWQKTEFEIEAKEKLVREILTNVMGGIPTVTLNARATGSWSNLTMGMNSNLGEALAAGFKAELDARIKAAKDQLNRLINDKIGGEKEKLLKEFSRVKGQVDQLVSSKQSEMNKAKSDLSGQMKGQKDKGQKKELKKLEEQGKKLLKGFKF